MRPTVCKRIWSAGNLSGWRSLLWNCGSNETCQGHANACGTRISAFIEEPLAFVEQMVNGASESLYSERWPKVRLIYAIVHSPFNSIFLPAALPAASLHAHPYHRYNRPDYCNCCYPESCLGCSHIRNCSRIHSQTGYSCCSCCSALRLRWAASEGTGRQSLAVAVEVCPLAVHRVPGTAAEEAAENADQETDQGIDRAAGVEAGMMAR
jgi:hypothetical protein